MKVLKWTKESAEDYCTKMDDDLLKSISAKLLLDQSGTIEARRSRLAFRLLETYEEADFVPMPELDPIHAKEARDRALQEFNAAAMQKFDEALAEEQQLAAKKINDESFTLDSSQASSTPSELQTPQEIIDLFSKTDENSLRIRDQILAKVNTNRQTTNYEDVGTQQRNQKPIQPSTKELTELIAHDLRTRKLLKPSTRLSASFSNMRLTEESQQRTNSTGAYQKYTKTPPFFENSLTLQQQQTHSPRTVENSVTQYQQNRTQNQVPENNYFRPPRERDLLRIIGSWNIRFSGE